MDHRMRYRKCNKKSWNFLYISWFSSSGCRSWVSRTFVQSTIENHSKKGKKLADSTFHAKKMAEKCVPPAMVIICFLCATLYKILKSSANESCQLIIRIDKLIWRVPDICSSCNNLHNCIFSDVKWVVVNHNLWCKHLEFMLFFLV